MQIKVAIQIILAMMVNMDKITSKEAKSVYDKANESLEEAGDLSEMSMDDMIEALK
tara:strand:- start:328 stop:495 length:168 start_codon:yes stop_codon:yes gene_type:complete